MSLLLVLIVQVQDPASLIRQLDDEDPIVRERATQQLMKIGAPALPALRKASASRKPETVARARALIKRIERFEKLRTVIPPSKRVTLDMNDVTLEEVAASLAKQTGYKILVTRRLRTRRVASLVLKNVPLLEALTQLPDIALSADRGLTIRDADANHYAVKARGPLHVIVAESTAHYSAGEGALELRFTLEPSHKAVKVIDLDVLEIRDGDGDPLSILDDAEPDSPENYFSFLFADTLPPQLSRLRLQVEVIYAVETRAVRVAPTEKEQVTLAGGIRFTYSVSLTRHKDKLDVNVRAQAEEDTPSTRRTMKLLRSTHIRLARPKARGVSASGGGASWSPDDWSMYTFRTSFSPRTARIGEVEFDVVTDSESRIFEFDFRDLKLRRE